jgi:hypothetical protein
MRRSVSDFGLVMTDPAWDLSGFGLVTTDPA